MVLTVVVTLLALWTAVGVVVAVLIGRSARIADVKRHDAMFLDGLDTAPRPASDRSPVAVLESASA